MGTGSRLLDLDEEIIIKLLLTCGPPTDDADYTLKFVAARETLGISGMDLTVGGWRYIFMKWKATRAWADLADSEAMVQILKDLEKEKGALPGNTRPTIEE